MPLRDTLDRLTAGFAQQIIAALRDASLEELAARAASAASAAPSRRTRGATAASSARGQGRVEGARPRAPRARGSVATAPREVTVVSAALRSASLDILAERGRKGATATQLDADLAARGFTPVIDLMRLLAQSGAVRDSGFRRASGGNATSPVYVIADGRNDGAGHT